MKTLAYIKYKQNFTAPIVDIDNDIDHDILVELLVNTLKNVLHDFYELDTYEEYRQVALSFLMDLRYMTDLYELQEDEYLNILKIMEIELDDFECSIVDDQDEVGITFEGTIGAEEIMATLSMIMGAELDYEEVGFIMMEVIDSIYQEGYSQEVN